MILTLVQALTLRSYTRSQLDQAKILERVLDKCITEAEQINTQENELQIDDGATDYESRITKMTVSRAEGGCAETLIEAAAAIMRGDEGTLRFLELILLVHLIVLALIGRPNLGR